MKVSELRDGEYGTYGGALIIKYNNSYIVAYNHEVKECIDLPWDFVLDTFNGLVGDREYIVQYDAIIEVASAECIEQFIKAALIKNKDINHITITRI